MLIFAVLFAGLAILGSLAGIGTLGHPIGGQALNSYGWALSIDATAIAALLVIMSRRRRPLT